MKIIHWYAGLSACFLVFQAAGIKNLQGQTLSPASVMLETQFASPSPQFRPEIWFHLIGGNIGKPGITADLDAIKAAGFSGIQLFNEQLGGPWPGVEPQITCLSSQWDEMIRHVARETERLGLRFTMQNCPGWSMAGGPWITPPDAMRELIWSRTTVAGRPTSSIKLPQPQPSDEDWSDYRDIAIIAFPTPAGDDASPLQPHVIRSNRPDLAWAAILDPAKTGELQLAPAGEPIWFEAEFAEPVTLRSLQLPPVAQFTLQHEFNPAVSLHIQAVTKTGRVDIARRAIPRSSWRDNYPLTLALPETIAKTFRFTFENKYPLKLDRFLLLAAARVDDWEGKAAYVLRSLNHAPVSTQSRTAWIAPERILDISDRMTPDGTLAWSPPDGGISWTVLRFGHVNTGAHNSPAPQEATGFECNKFSAAAAEKHFNGYIGRLSAKAGPVGTNLHGMLMDSWECRIQQTWTKDMEAEFARLNGYGLRPWLPALAGYVVGDPATSDRYLRDWRATVNALYVEKFFGTMEKLAHQRGLSLSFETAMGDTAPGDSLEYFKHADVPMCEFWQPDDPQWGGEETKPILPCVSAAHIYGKPRIAAEAFTSLGVKWNEHPGLLKSFADHNFALGLNQLMFQAYTHNPRINSVPGASYGVGFGAGIGTPFLRGQTWWNYMPVFTDYLTRCQFLLTQGHPVTDVLWYLGDEFDHKPRQDTLFPSGYRFDYCNQDVLLHRLNVDNGKLMTPEGVAWRVLWIPNSERLTPATLVKLQELLAAGATIVAAPPQSNATLIGGQAAEKDFQTLVKNIWDDAAAA